MGTIQILQTSITSLETDAIVNAANEGLWQGSGVCGAIFHAAGAAQLRAASNEIGGCPTGSAVITPGFNLKAKYIIHAVGPRWAGGTFNEPELLYSAYRESLALAARNGCRSIGFPLISAGVFHYPLRDAWRIAIQACLDFGKEFQAPDVVFAVIDENILDTGREILAEMTGQTMQG